jgi:hypothetical protein
MRQPQKLGGSDQMLSETGPNIKNAARRHYQWPLRIIAIVENCEKTANAQYNSESW